MAGLWYRTGSVAVTQSSKKITGTGTSWQTALNRPSKGNVFYGPDGKAYEIDYISSETELYLVDVYTGANASSQSYKIDVRGGTVPELSRQLSEHYAYMQGIIDALQSIVSGSGDVTVTGPDGQTVTVPALANMLSKSGNLAGLTDKAAARANIGAYKQGDASGLDLNTVTVTGEYQVGGTEAHWAFPGTGGHLYVHELVPGSYVTQIAVSGANGQFATRTMSPSGWGPWDRLYSTVHNNPAYAAPAPTLGITCGGGYSMDAIESVCVAYPMHYEIQAIIRNTGLGTGTDLLYFPENIRSSYCFIRFSKPGNPGPQFSMTERQTGGRVVSIPPEAAGSEWIVIHGIFQKI